MDYITTGDAADILGVSARRVQAMIRAGVLPARKFGKAYMIAEKDVLWLKAQDRRPGWTKNPTPKK